MLAHLFLAVALGQTSMFRTIVTTPTGENGYEEYVQAAQYAARADFGGYQQLNNWNRKQDYDGTLPDGLKLSDSRLAVRRKFVAKFEPCLALIRQGNSKPCWDPRQNVTAETLFPEFAYFKSLAKLEATAAYVAFADGQNSLAIQRIEDGITFASHFSSGMLISRLVGIACTSIMVAELDRNWRQLSVPDADEVSDFLTKLMAQPSGLKETFMQEGKFGAQNLRQVLDDPSKLQLWTGGGDNAPKTPDPFANMTPGQMQAEVGRAADELQHLYAKLEEALDGPEDQWLTSVAKIEKGRTAAGASPASVLADAISPTFQPSVVAFIRQRSRLRMAYLTARAIRYRWEAGELPSKIEDFSSAQERKDPSTGANFAYRREATWFRIVRQSTDEVGDIRLGPVAAAPTAEKTLSP